MDDLSIEPYRTDLNLVRQTAEQVIKDVQLSGLTIQFSGNPYTAYQELHDQLVPMLKELYKSDSHAFRALLYRIDISEREYNRMMDGPAAMEQLAESVLQREFKKVLIRNYYKELNRNNPS